MSLTVWEPKTGVQARFEGSNLEHKSAEELASLANDHHGHHLGCLRRAIEDARLAGAALAEVKRRLSHGEFTPWLKEHFLGSPETARDYMRVAENWPGILDAELEEASLSQVLTFLASRKPKPPSLNPESDDSEADDTEVEDPPSPEQREITLHMVFVDPDEVQQVNEMIQDLREQWDKEDVAAIFLEATRRFYRLHKAIQRSQEKSGG